VNSATSASPQKTDAWILHYQVEPTPANAIPIDFRIVNID
jgi:hypothetical protein